MAKTSMIMSAMAPMTSCSSASLVHVLLRGGAGGEEGELLGAGEQLVLGGQWAFAVFFRGRAGHDLVHQRLDGGHQGELAGHRGLHDPAGDDQPVDLVGAFEDAVDARVAIGALCRVLLDVAVAGEDLHHSSTTMSSISEAQTFTMEHSTA